MFAVGSGDVHGGSSVLGEQRCFDDMGAHLIEVPFCVLDLETTGATAASCEITEIGAVRYVGGRQTGTFQSLVNPGIAIPPFITVLTGITHAMVVEAPRIEVVLEDGDLEIDNNGAERSLRGVAVGRNYAQAMIMCSPQSR